MNNRERMYETNSAIKKELVKQGFHNLYLFPHLRWLKDYHLGGIGFDALGLKNDDKNVWLFQFKTNEKPSKFVLEQFKEINERYYVKCCWITKKINFKL